MADTAISGLPAASAVVGANEFAINEAGTTKKVTADQIKTFIFTGGTVTVSTPVIDATQTWNASGVTFTGWNLDVTDTASATASRLLALRVGAADKFLVLKAGNVYSGVDGTSAAVSFGRSSAQNTGIYFPGGNQVDMVANGTTVFRARSTGFALGTGTLIWGGDLANTDVTLTRGAASVLALTGASSAGGAIDLLEMTAPSAGATNHVRVYAEDNGSGKTKLMALFPTGTAVQLAIEP